MALLPYTYWKLFLTHLHRSLLQFQVIHQYPKHPHLEEQFFISMKFLFNLICLSRSLPPTGIFPLRSKGKSNCRFFSCTLSLVSPYPHLLLFVNGYQLKDSFWILHLSCHLFCSLFCFFQSASTFVDLYHSPFNLQQNRTELATVALECLISHSGKIKQILTGLKCLLRLLLNQIERNNR